MDTRNSHDDINGYSSVQEYKNYLKDKGIDIGVFVADPLTDEEKLLKKSSEEYITSPSERDGLFQDFKEGKYKELFEKFIETMSFLDLGLMEKHFDQLSDQQRNFYLSHIGDDGLRFLLKYSSKPDELINEILPYVKDKLDSSLISDLLRYSSNKDGVIDKILPYVKDDLDPAMVSFLLRDSSKPDELINQILPFIKDDLDTAMMYFLLKHSSNPDELKKRIDDMKFGAKEQDEI